jgi:hypothetical protein
MIKKYDVELRYKHVERALVDVERVPQKEIGAFRARLRHLRNIGCPALPASGSGTHITYSGRQTLEMLIAIELENSGHKPHSAATLAGSIVRQSPYGQHERKDCYVVPSAPSENQAEYKIMYGLEDVYKFMKRTNPRLFTAVNVSALVRELETALDRSVKGI